MARQSLGTARCGPACRVVWGLGEKNPRLPDSAMASPLKAITLLIIYPEAREAWHHERESHCPSYASARCNQAGMKCSLSPHTTGESVVYRHMSLATGNRSVASRIQLVGRGLLVSSGSDRARCLCHST